jgi:MFS family permease
MGMKIISRPLLKRFGHKTILLSNTVLLGLTMMVFTQIDRDTPLVAILALSFSQGFFASLQFTAMNSLVYADIDDAEASKASSISATAQQLSLSFGVALGSLVAGWFLGPVDQRDPGQAIPALHQAFLTLGIITIVSAVTFIGLGKHDGNNISHRLPLPPRRHQLRAESRAEIGAPERTDD